MTDKPTICYHCKNHLYLAVHGSRDIWYNHVCTKVPLPVIMNYVTGKEEQGGSGSHGFSYCRDINKDGKCPHFEPQQTWFEWLKEGVLGG